MQLRKSFALLAAMLVGFGAGSADAANVTSVSVTSPDSGVVRGIDSTFVIKAVIEDFSPEAQDGVLLYLWTGSDSSGVLTGPTTSPTLEDSSGAIITAAAILTSVFGGTPSSGTALVAVGANIDANGDTSAVVGHFDSVHVTLDNASQTELKTYTWYGKVTGAFGTNSGVRAAAIAYDATEDSYTQGPTSDVDANLSLASEQFRVDGDRPTTAQIITTSGSAVGRARTARDTSASPIHTFNFTNASSKRVLGISDTLAFNVKLGAAATSVLSSNSTLKVVADIGGSTFNVSTNGRGLDTLKFRRVITAGDFGNLVGTDNAAGIIDTLEVFVVDAAGNRSDYNDTDTANPPLGVSVATNFFLDAKAPVLDGGVAAGDTILPVSNDTITDGGHHAAFSNDLNEMRFELAEALDSLLIGFDNGDTDATIKLYNTRGANAPTDVALGKITDSLHVNFTAFGNADSLTWVRLYNAASGTQVASYDSSLSPGQTIKTGLQTVTFQGVDLGGNRGPVLTRTNVYVDVDDLGFDRLFPTVASALDTIEEETSKVVFRLTEDADSVLITYTPLSGNGTVTRRRALVGPELTSDFEQTFVVDSLVTGTNYKLQLLGADLAGNYTATTPDTFVYDTTYVVPVIASFDIASTRIDSLGSGGATTLSNLLYHPTAGDTLTLTLQAKTIDDADAVTYKELAFMKVTGGSTASITGTGVTAVDGIAGRFQLSADDWITGARSVKIVGTQYPDSISVTVIDSSDTTNIYSGVIDSVIGYAPAALNKIALAADDTVGQGDAFWVGVTLADKFGNMRPKDDAWIEVSSSALGVSLPNNAIEVIDGTAGFWANSPGYAGSLKILARSVQGAGIGSIVGSTSVYVNGDGAMVLDDPDTLIAQDYMGALGNGDQGGFVLLTFPVSDDHSTLSGYRIYREISVNVGPDGNGGLVDLAAPETAMVPWGRADAVPGQSVMRVVVATLDGDLTRYSVAAERGGLSSGKEAFDSADAVGSPYELMAETMVKSKEAAQLDPSAPVFATLTPEAMAFATDGVLPNFKTVDGTLLSALRSTVNAVRAIDNIAPAPVTNLTVADTPGDVGGSITVGWMKSVDDRILTTTVAGAVSEVNSYSAPGVEGYNVYRRIGDSAWQLAGQTSAGATSYEDATVFNGVRYAYKVEARDADNVTDSQIAKSAMAIRNNVFDASGQPVLGLFGGDTKVDIDDFFIFADHFGMQAGVDGFDKAFDLAPNNAVDLADFFVFADNYGREVVGAGKVVPTMAGLNSDARFVLDAGAALPAVGEEISVAVNLEDYVEIRGYGLSVEFDSELLEFVEPRVVDNALGEQPLAAPHAFTGSDGNVAIVAFGETMGEGDLGLNLVFRTKQEIESSYIDVTSGALQDGSYGLNRITSPVSIRVETRPEVYALADNYPNPFNPETTIKYQLPEAGQVTLEVYNMLGQVVKTLVNNQFQNAGRYALQWDATNNSGQPLSSGVYFYRIVAGGEFQSHKKMLLLK